MNRSTSNRGIRAIGALATVASGVMLGVWAAGLMRPEPAQAIPMFAIRTGASCDLCHTTFPGMTNYGMMVMMSNFAMLPHDAAHYPGITSLVFSEQFDSAPDVGVPKLHTDNLGFLSGGFVGRDFTYYLEQHVIDNGFVGGTDQFWMSYNNLFSGTGALQFGKFHTPFPFMPAHRITLAPYETTSYTVGENDFNEDDSHWGVTMSQMQGTLMYGLSALGGNDLIGNGAFALAGDHNHSIDFSLMTMSDQPLNYGIGLIKGYAPLSEGGFDPFSRDAVYLQYRPAGAQGLLQFQVVGQLGYDANPTATNVAVHTRGGFVEAQYELPHKNFMVLRWDTQNFNNPQAGLTLDIIHQFAPNTKFTMEGRSLTTGSTMGMSIEWAGPWSRSRIVATPHLGNMAGMNMSGMNMSGMSMGGMPMGGSAASGADVMSPLAHTLAHGDATRGAQDFTIHSCMQCHGVGGEGGGIGPRLIGVSTSLEPEQIYDFIKHPRAPMPDFQLSDDEIADLVAYVDSLTPGHTVLADDLDRLTTAGLRALPALRPPRAISRTGHTKTFTLTLGTAMVEPLPGHPVAVRGINGLSPGPILRMTEGDDVEITVVNRLTLPVTIHWHGIPVPFLMDGAAMISQQPLKPDQAFVYRFTAPQAGTYMYHSHFNDLELVSVSGMIVVDPQAPGREPHYASDVPMFISSIEWEQTRNVEARAVLANSMLMSSMASNPSADPIPAMGDAMDRMDMVEYWCFNGKSFPATKPIAVKNGDLVRVRFGNLTNMTHPIHLHGHWFRVIAQDGSPLPQPAIMNTVPVHPGQTVDIDFLANNPGVWPLHCHIVAHMVDNHDVMSGLMTVVQYEGFGLPAMMMMQS